MLKIWVGKLQVLDLELRNYGDVTEQLGDKMPHPNRTNLVLSGLIKRCLAQHHSCNMFEIPSAATWRIEVNQCLLKKQVIWKREGRTKECFVFSFLIQ